MGKCIEAFTTITGKIDDMGPFQVWKFQLTK